MGEFDYYRHAIEYWTTIRTNHDFEGVKVDLSEDDLQKAIIWNGDLDPQFGMVALKSFDRLLKSRRTHD